MVAAESDATVEGPRGSRRQQDTSFRPGIFIRIFLVFWVCGILFTMEMGLDSVLYTIHLLSRFLFPFLFSGLSFVAWLAPSSFSRHSSSDLVPFDDGI